MNISSKKLLRDILIVAVVAIVGLIVLNRIPTAHKHSPDCEHNQSSALFQLDSQTPVLRIEDSGEYTLGVIDHHAKKDFEMRAMGEHELDEQLLMTYRISAISRLIQDHVNRKFAIEHDLSISDEEIDKEFETTYARHGGKDKFLDIMAGMGLDEDSFRRLIAKNILEDKILTAVSTEIASPDDLPLSEERKVQLYLQWLNTAADELDVEILDPILKHAYEMATSVPSGTVMPPH